MFDGGVKEDGRLSMEEVFDDVGANIDDQDRWKRQAKETVNMIKMNRFT